MVPTGTTTSDIRMSHGCVNLSIGDSHWLYDWANVGDSVYVYDPSGRDSHRSDPVMEPVRLDALNRLWYIQPAPGPVV